jgi:hypothetical protein
VTETDEQRIERLRAELEDLERRYADAELKGSGRTAASARRGPVSLIAVLLGVALAVGVVAAVDLRRLQTPTGAVLGWTGAAVFGDCTAYRELSVPEPDEPAADAQCRALRSATERNRDRAGEVELEVVALEEIGDDAVATVRLVRPGQGQRRFDVPLRRTGDGWAVRRTEAVCAVVTCP